jgi:hypothetical protein
MKAIAASLLILGTVLAVHFASGASTRDRPAGVDVQNWIPVSDKIGFFVTTPAYIRRVVLPSCVPRNGHSWSFVYDYGLCFVRDNYGVCDQS